MGDSQDGPAGAFVSKPTVSSLNLATEVEAFVRKPFNNGDERIMTGFIWLGNIFLIFYCIRSLNGYFY